MSEATDLLDTAEGEPFEEPVTYAMYTPPKYRHNRYLSDGVSVVIMTATPYGLPIESAHTPQTISTWPQVDDCPIPLEEGSLLVCADWYDENGMETEASSLRKFHHYLQSDE